MKRPFLYASLALISGELIANWLKPENSLPPIICALVLFLISLAPNKSALLAGLFLIGVARPGLDPMGPDLKGQEYRLYLQITSSGNKSASAQLFAKALKSKPWIQKSGAIELIFKSRPPQPGTYVLATARPLPKSALPGALQPDWANYLKRSQTTLYVSNYKSLGHQLSLKPIPGKHPELIRALSVGDRTQVSKEQLELFRKTGTSHLLAISGLHIGLVAGMAGLIFLKLTRIIALFRPRSHSVIFASLIMIIATLAYGEVAQWPISAKRAAIMVIIGSLLVAFERSKDFWNLLGAAAFIIALLSPGAITSASFQLSFGAIAGILLVVPRLTRLLPPDLHPITIWLANGIFTTIAATLGTIPASALYFQEISTTSIFANLIAGPLVGLVATPAALLTIAGPIPQITAFIADIAIDGTLFWLKLMESEPIRLAVTPFGALILAVALILRKYPMTSVAFAILALGLRFYPYNRLTMTFLDVGQGDSVLIEWPDGKRWLVDGGPPGEQLLQYLTRRGLYTLDKVILTHNHDDHYGGLESVISKLNIKQVITYNYQSDIQQIIPIKNQIILKGQIPFRLSSEAEIIHPQTIVNSKNNMSLVVKINYLNRSFLLTGDIEQDAESVLLEKIEKVDVLKVPHHGARQSSSQSFIDVLNPELAIISCGQKNRHGHPHKQTLGRYFGIKLLRTDISGTIEVSTDGTDLQVRTQKTNWQFSSEILN